MLSAHHPDLALADNFVPPADLQAELLSWRSSRQSLGGDIYDLRWLDRSQSPAIDERVIDAR